MPVHEYTRLENGIHHIKLHESSKRAVDAWFEVMDTIYQNEAPDATLRILVDVRAGMLPLAYTLTAARAFIKRYPKRQASRVVFYHERDFLLSFVQTAVNLYRRRQSEQVAFFAADFYEQALAWLLADES